MTWQTRSASRPGEGSRIQQHSRFPATVWAVAVLALAWILTTTTFGAPASPVNAFFYRASSDPQPHALAGAQADPGTLVRIGDGSEPKYVVEPGGQVTVPVEVVDAVNLGAATVLLSYDPAVVHAVGCVGPPSDVFDGGYCNIEFALGVVKFNVIALDGVDGTHRLYDVTFEAVGGGAGATLTDLTLTVEHFADPLGNALDVDTTGGEIEIVGEPEPVDAVVRVGDEAQSDYTLIPGNTISVTVTLSITGTRKLGAATMLLRYDPQVVRPTMCSQPEEIMGYCNPAFDPEAGLVKFNLVSSDGLTGTLHAYDVWFEVVSGVAAGEISDLVLIVEHFADTMGSPMSWQAVNGSITVAAGPSNSAWLLVGAPSETGVYTVTHGTTVTVSIWVTDVVGLGAATLSLGYDPTVVRPLGCAVRNGASGIDGGVCALHDGHVQANIISSQGISGTARLYDVDFTPALGVSVGATSTLTLTVENFADTAAVPVPSRVRNGSIEIEEGGSEPTVALVRVGNDGGVFDLPQDDRVAVPIRVEGAANLGAATLSLSYDPAVVRPVSCTPVSDAFDGGYCNPWAEDGLARLNVVSVDGFTGDATLFDLTFQPAGGAAVGDETDLALTVTNFASPAADALLYQTAPGRIDITEMIGTPQVILRVGDGPYQVAVGERVTVPISAVIDAEETPLGLGAATLVLDYDPAVVQPISCALNDAGGDGFDGGGCNLNYAEGQLRFNALSVTGVTSDTTIVEIEFEAVGQEGEVTPLMLNVDHLADTAANALTHRIAPGEIKISAPHAVDDSATVVVGGTVSVLDSGEASVLANDSDPEGDDLTVTTTPVSGPSHGALTLNGDGTFSYTHDGSETTSDSFIYEVCDDGTPPTCATATVDITVIAPDLTVSKANDVGGAIFLGYNWTWTLTVQNSGNADATFADGQTLLSDDLPSTDMSYDTPSVTNVNNVTGSASISCVISGSPPSLTCSASGGDVTIATTNGSFDVQFTTTPSAAGTFDNPRGGGRCEVDPDNHIAESNEGNNTADDDSVTVTGGTITIVKDAVPDAPQNFSFSGDLGSFTLDDATPDDGDAFPHTITFSDLPPNPYTLTEALPPSWDLTDFTCQTDDQNDTSSLNGTTAIIDLDPGEIITCTITNTKRGIIIVQKQTVPTGDTIFDFVHDVDATARFNLSHGQNHTFSDVAPGTYTVTEDDPLVHGFELTELVCVDDDPAGTPSTTNLEARQASIHLNPGETVNCTFTNTQKGSITIEKITDPPGGTGFAFTHTIDPLNPFNLDHDQRQTFTNIRPGTYTVTETDPLVTPGHYDLTDLVCVETGTANSSADVATRIATITFEVGEIVICTFTNTWSLFGDLDLDCDVDVGDVMLVANRWRTSCANPDPDNDPGTANYEDLYDLDDDCDIDIVDIMLVVAHWGETC